MLYHGGGLTISPRVQPCLHAVALSMSMIESNRFRRSRKVRRDWGKFVRIVSIFLALIAVNAPAYAATVKALQGQVLVNAGQGYRLVDGSIQLEPGGTVVANPGAVAQVVYAGGCTVTVQPGSVYLIAPQAPCQTGEPTKTGDLTDAAAPVALAGVSAATWATGAVAVAGGGAAAYFLLPPMSP